MIRTSNKRCAEYVRQRIPFKANHIFAEYVNGRYVVFSYGYHFPMYLYDKNNRVWFKNIDKYSQSTSCHQTQAQPYLNCIKVNTKQIKALME